ncbi:MerR family transcriptional regulator [Pendulispora albinea]|uniref:MerR family transcriptional regulator n=1 Tax=Pendulispora albinea TaxID=2741071 RepID=A0ABZ2M393_9BACT
MALVPRPPPSLEAPRPLAELAGIESSKLYFRIGEVAAIVGVESHVLRYWEREFRTIRPTKSAKGQRVYSRRDLENLLRIRDLLYKEGFTIAGAKKQLATARQEPLAVASAESLEHAGVSTVSTVSPVAPVAPAAPAAPGAPAAPVASGAPVAPAPPISFEIDLTGNKMRQALVDLRSEIEGFLAEEW